jgi:hypothetical protein
MTFGLVVLVAAVRGAMGLVSVEQCR